VRSWQMIKDDGHRIPERFAVGEVILTANPSLDQKSIRAPIRTCHSDALWKVVAVWSLGLE